MKLRFYGVGFLGSERGKPLPLQHLAWRLVEGLWRGFHWQLMAGSAKLAVCAAVAAASPSVKKQAENGSKQKSM